LSNAPSAHAKFFAGWGHVPLTDRKRPWPDWPPGIRQCPEPMLVRV